MVKNMLVKSDFNYKMKKKSYQESKHNFVAPPLFSLKFGFSYKMLT